MQDGFRQGLWRLADPKITLTSLAAMAVGLAPAAAEQPVAWGWFALTAFAFFMLEVAKNATGDIVDYDSGTDLAVAAADRTDFSGGKRVLVDGLLSRQQTWAIAIVFGLLGVLAGAAIVVWREPQALWIGALGLGLGWSYHGAPLKLAYRGLGELDVVLCYGPLGALATYLVQTHHLSWPVFWLSLPLGLIIAAFLWVNQFPDYAADLASGKRNLVVVLGKRRASLALPGIYLAAFAVLAAVPASGLSHGVYLAFLAAVPAAYASWHTLRRPETFHREAPVQPAALIAFLVYAVGAGIGALVG